MGKKSDTPILDSLSPKHRKFVMEYAADGDGKRAAIEAGYLKKSAATTAAKLLALSKIKAAIKEFAAPIQEEAGLTVERLTEQLVNYVFRSIKDFVGPDGYLITNVAELPDHVAQCIEEWVVDEQFTYNPKTHEREITGQKVKVKMVSKAKMQDLAMKYKQMIVPVQVNVDQRTNHNHFWQAAYEAMNQSTEDTVEQRVQQRIEDSRGTVAGS